MSSPPIPPILPTPASLSRLSPDDGPFYTQLGDILATHNPVLYKQVRDALTHLDRDREARLRRVMGAK